MKKILVAISLAAFVLSAPLAMAADVKCCKDGKCQKGMKTAEDCTKAGGTVVKNCTKDCVKK